MGVNKSNIETKVEIKIQNQQLNLTWNNSFSSPLRRVSIPPRRSSRFYLRNTTNRGHYLPGWRRSQPSGISNCGFVSDSEDQQSCSTGSVFSFSLDIDEDEDIAGKCLFEDVEEENDEVSSLLDNDQDEE